MNRLLLLFTLIIYTTTIAANPVENKLPPFDEAQVFEWWDDGIITPSEADEIFSRLEEENYEEACLLAEVYAQEPCASSKKAKKSKKTRTERKSKPSKTAQEVPSIAPHGQISWKGQYDSDGHLKKLRKELQIQFYYFRFRFGSQELLSYRRDGFEAHFGQISTLEFHSHLPLDTLWGTAISVPIGKFQLGAFLDTSRAFHTHLGFQMNRSNELSATFWKFPDESALALQARTSLGQVSAWYQFGQDFPLVKIQLQSEKTHLSWKTTAYFHGDSIPQGLNLSKGIAENRLWASQTVTAHWPEALNTSFSAKARVLSPIGSDSVSARFKFSLESGPERLRPSLSATCIEASENCNSTEWKGGVESAWEQFTFKSSARFRHSKGRTKPPRIEIGASYRKSSRTFAKLTVAFPESNPAKSISLQNEFRIDNDFLGCDFIFAFKKTKKRPFQPNYAHLEGTFKF